jgi:selenocysteine lyase/cysteine desulfurase
MLPSQRALFDIPREICYLNAASWSPLPVATQEAGRVGVARKGQPWLIDQAFAAGQHERARRAAARLIDADPDDVALISSVSYGVAAAAKLLTVPAGSRVLVLENDHSSAMLEWLTRARAGRFTVDVVPQPREGAHAGDWTAAVLAAIERPGTPPVGLASISSVHWSDGGMIDIERVAAALRRQGAALLVDATHAIGVLEHDVRSLDPDFLIFPTYKWLLGPYGRAFLYIANGVPLEQTSYGRRAIASERETYYRDIEFVPGARRFDMGERDHFISLEMASIGMEMVAEWGCDAVQARLRALTRRLADGLRDCAVMIPDAAVRAPHILSLRFPAGMPQHLIERLAAEHVYVAPRVGRMRISPHVYNDEDDIDRFVATFRRLAWSS